MFKKIFTLFFCVALFQINSTIAQQQFFSVKGKEILGADGKPFLIRGTNLGNWLNPEGYMFRFEAVNSPRLINTAFSELIGPVEAKNFWKKFVNNYITKQDIAYIKKMGANSIRVPFHYKLFTSEDYLGENNPQHGFEIFDKLLKWCNEEKLYVILDMHCAPDGQTGDNIDDGYGYPFLYESEQAQDLVVKIWAAIASKYKNEKIIIGYDLLNEPIAHYFDTKKLNPLLEPLYKKIVAAIRKTDKNHLVFLGGAQWDTNFEIFGKPFDDKAVYTFHKYWMPTEQKEIQSYINFRDKYNVPIYCGETGENENSWINDFRILLEKNNIGWHYWPYKKLDNKRGIVTFAKPAYYDSLIAYTKKSRANFEEIRNIKIEDRKLFVKCLNDYLDSCTFENCKPNAEYINALGFKP